MAQQATIKFRRVLTDYVGRGDGKNLPHLHVRGIENHGWLITNHKGGLVFLPDPELANNPAPLPKPVEAAC